MKWLSAICILLIVGTPIVPASAAESASSKNTMTLEQRRQKLHELLSGRSAARSTKAAAVKAAKKEGAGPMTSPEKNFRQIAIDEIKPAVTPNARGAAAGVSAATVQTQSLIPEDPVHYEHFQIGFSATPYRPQGFVPLTGLGTYDLSRSTPSILWGLEGRMLPWRISRLGDLGLGFRVGVQYTKQSIDLVGPTGKALDGTVLNSLISSVWFSVNMPIPSLSWLSWNADVGPSRLDLIQTSQTTLANQSDSLWLASIRTGPSFHWKNWDVEINYRYRAALRPSAWARVASSSVSLGVLYGLR